MISRFVGDSERRPPGPAAAVPALALFIIAAGLCLPARAAAAAGPARIGKITMLVDDRPASPDMESLTSLKPGDPFSPYAVSEAVKQAFSTGLFSDVQVFRSGGEEVDLTFRLTRQLLIRSIRFRGRKGLSSRRLSEALVSLRTDNYISDERLEKAVEEIKAALGHDGYFQPMIRTSVVRDTRGPEVEVNFEIAAGARYVISDIRFEGRGRVTPGDLRKEMKTRAGQAYSLARLEKDLQRIRDLYRGLGFPRASVETAPESFFLEEGTVALVIKIDTGERVDIVIGGAKVPVKLLQPIWEAPIFEEWGMSEDEARILTDLRGKGYIFASVRSTIEKIEDGIRVNHQVSPGKKYRITDIQFEGNRHLTAEELRKQLLVSESTGVFGSIDGKRVFELQDDIEALYQSRGFADVQVNLHFHESDSQAVASFSIEEGAQRRARKVTFSGAGLVDEATLRRQIALAEGGPYFGPAIQRDVQILEAYYLDQGIRGTRIEARAVPAGENEFDVSFSIQEGARTNVQGVFISGNLVTRPGTILKEMKVKEGDLARAESITATRTNLEKLAVFSEVRIDEIPLTPGSENLVVRLREGERNYVGLGIGIETRDELQTSSITSADLRPRATAEFMRSNVLGRASHLSLVSQFSLAEKRLIVNWEQPYFLFFGFRVPTYISGWIEEEDRVSFGYKREGVSVSAIKPIFWELTLLAAVRYARTTLYFLDIAPNEIDREFYPYSATTLETSFIREKRDDQFNPTRGYFSSLGLVYAFPLFATESDFLKMVFKYQRYFPLASRATFGSTFRLGLGTGLMPIHERFFAGGSNSFRGQKFDELGPKDPLSGLPVGGKAMVLFNFEAVFPLLSSVRDLGGALFYDVGNVFPNMNDVKLADLENAVGLGVRYRTPFGPIRLELGWNLTNPEQKGKPIFFFTIGNLF